jgi:hypothetical protein
MVTLYAGIRVYGDDSDCMKHGDFADHAQAESWLFKYHAGNIGYNYSAYILEAGEITCRYLKRGRIWNKVECRADSVWNKIMKNN